VEDNLTEQEYLTQRLENQINWYSEKSSECQRHYKWLRQLEIVAAAVIPFLSGMIDSAPGSKWVIGILGIIIALSTAATSLFKYHENWIQYRITAEQLKHEKYLFATRSGPYQSDAPLSLLVERVETLISKEAGTWAQTVREAVKSTTNA
jgi:hypothetical protein